MVKDIRKASKKKYLRGIYAMAALIMMSGCGVTEKDVTTKDNIILEKYNIEDDIKIEDILDNDTEVIKQEGASPGSNTDSTRNKYEIKNIYVNMDIKDRTVLKVELTNESILEKEYEGTWATTTYQADLLNTMENVVVLVLTNET